jgi:phage terminase large subunit-like protein
VGRLYADPRHFETQIDQWAAEYGEDVVMEFPTGSITRMFPALVRYREDLAEGLTTHSEDDVMKRHALAARKVAKPGDKFLLGKPSDNQKIDLIMADVLAHEAAADARASGWGAATESYAYVF